MPCKLCLENKPLCKSHILPEWLYEGIYDEYHKYLMIFSDKNERRRTRSKGLYERLLCRVCEEKIGKWEDHAKNILRGNTNIIRSKDRYAYKGVNYTKFKLFLLSILWRASLSHLKGVYPVDLKPFDERIRLMLYNENPGQPHEFGATVLYPELFKPTFDQLIEFPKYMGENRATDPAPTYITIFDKKIWLFFLTDDPNLLPEKHILLGESGVLPVFSDGGHSSKYMLRGFKSFKDSGMFDNLPEYLKTKNRS